MLAPSERFYRRRRRAYKKLTDWMRQSVLQVRRWVPERDIVFVADSAYAAIGLLWRMTQLANTVTIAVGSRQDAALYESLAPSFSDGLAAVRLELWRQLHFQISRATIDMTKLSNVIVKRLAEALCYLT